MVESLKFRLALVFVVAAFTFVGSLLYILLTRKRRLSWWAVFLPWFGVCWLMAWTDRQGFEGASNALLLVHLGFGLLALGKWRIDGPPFS